MSKGNAQRQDADHGTATQARMNFHGAANGSGKGTSEIEISSPSKGLSISLIGRQSEHRHQILQSRVNLVHGPAGTGKTFVPVAAGIELMYRADSPVQNILYVRTPVLAGGQDNPPVPGNEARKYARFIRPLTSVIESILGEQERKRIEQQISEFGYATLSKGKITAISPGDLRGDTLDNTMIILDEAGSANRAILDLMVGRLGVNSKLVISGDPSQNDMRQPSRQMADIAGLVEAFAKPVYDTLQIPADKLDEFYAAVQDVKHRYEPKTTTPFEDMIVAARQSFATGGNRKGLVSVFEYTAADIIRDPDNADIMAILSPTSLKPNDLRSLVKGTQPS